MANPQKENGYTSIANEILEHLAMMRINGEARQVLDVILRKTYGFGKKADKISLSQFCLYTKRSKPAVIRAIRKLQTYNLIIIKKDNDINIYQFNKDFDSWTPLSKKIITYMKKQTLKEYCYICGFKEALEQHHIIPISEGGQDKMSNKINLCPNCHTLAHRGKYSSDFLFIKKDNQENIIKKDNSDLQFVKKGLSKKIHTIDNTTKETITKDTMRLADAKTPQDFYSILLKDKQKHIRIIGLFVKKKNIIIENSDQCQSLIKRNLRPAKDLVGYDEKRIEEVIGHLNNNADYKWTLETVGKFIDEDLSRLKVGGKVKSDSDLLREIINSK